MSPLADPQQRQLLDPQNMYGDIHALPDQLAAGWNQGQTLPLPRTRPPRAVVLAGMGGSAIAGDLLVGYAQPLLPVPVVVWRAYDLPAWAQGEDVFVVASSHSGNTEETLSAAQTAQARGCPWLALTTGGRLSTLAQEHGATLWTFRHAGQPRAAIGLTFGLLLALFTRLGLLPDPAADLEDTLHILRQGRATLAASQPRAENPAKRLAEQWRERWVAVFGAEFLTPVARRWKGQVNELAKAWAQFESLPEADHNTLAGLAHPPHLRDAFMAVFLDAPALQPRNRLRVQHTERIFRSQGLSSLIVTAQGASRLAQQWSLLQLGDYAAYYLALAYREDPTPIPTIAQLKQALAQTTPPTDS